MSLDFAVLGQTEMPEKTVCLGVSEHHKLITAAAELGLSLFNVFVDYYEDATIDIKNLPFFIEQIQVLRNKIDSPDLCQFLDALSELVSYAIAQQKSLHAIAD